MAPPLHQKRKRPKVIQKATPSAFILRAVKRDVLRRRKVASAYLVECQKESEDILASKQQEVILKKKKLMKKMAEESGDPKYKQEREREKIQEMVAKTAVDRAARIKEVNARLVELEAKLEVLNSKKQELFHSLKDVLQSEQKEKEKKKDLAHMKPIPLSAPTRLSGPHTAPSIMSSLSSTQNPNPTYLSSKPHTSSHTSSSSSSSSSSILANASNSSISFSSFANTSHSSPSVSSNAQGMATYVRDHQQHFGGSRDSAYTKDTKSGYTFRHFPSAREFPSHSFPSQRYERYESFRPDPQKRDPSPSPSDLSLSPHPSDEPLSSSEPFSFSSSKGLQHPPQVQQASGALIHQQERFFGEGDAPFHEYLPPRPTLIRNRRPLPFQQQKTRMKRGWRRGPGGELPFLMHSPPVLPPHMIPLVPHPSHVLPPHLASGFPPTLFPPPHFVPVATSDPSLLYSLSLDPGRQSGHFAMSGGDNRLRQGQGGFSHSPHQQPQDRSDSAAQKERAEK